MQDHVLLLCPCIQDFVQQQPLAATTLLDQQDLCAGLCTSAHTRASLHIRSGQECIWDGSLNLLEEKYPEHFVRIHRSTLVRRQALRQLKHSIQADGGDSWLLQLEGLAGWLQVSRRQLPVVRQALEQV